MKRTFYIYFLLVASLAQATSKKAQQEANTFLENLGFLQKQ